MNARWTPLLIGAFAAVFVTAACEDGGGSRDVTTTPPAPAEGTRDSVVSTPVFTAQDLTPRPTPPPMGRALPDARVAEILDLWLEEEPAPDLLAASLAEVEQAVDQRFVAPLIELTWGSMLQIVHFEQRHAEVLASLTAQTFGRDWERWLAWYGRTDLQPPPGFVEWKGRLLSRIDPRFAGFLAADVPLAIRPELIAWGGVVVDGIVPLINPPIVAGRSSDAAYLQQDEPVLGLVVNGEARAYPYRIMDPHEMANDVLGGVPISIAHCTLCGSAIAYDGRGPDGVTYTFSTSGLLYESNKLMYDRQTRTLWNQFTGLPVLGPMVETVAARTTEANGRWFNAFPLVTTTWGAWLAEHPETTVLSIETGVASGYTLGYPYLQYYTGANPAFPLSTSDLRLNAHDWVYGVLIGGQAQAYDVRLLIRDRVVNDEVGGVDLVVVASSGDIEVVARDRLQTEATYDLGATVRAYERPAGTRFAPTEDPLVLVDGAGDEWRVTDEGLVSSDGRIAPRTFGRQSFWFAWHAFYPHTGLLGGR